jgi:hypothetical protein
MELGLVLCIYNEKKGFEEEIKEGQPNNNNNHKTHPDFVFLHN